MDCWQLPVPRLLISVTGGAKRFYLRPRLKNILKQGLVSAAVSTGNDAVVTVHGCIAGNQSQVYTVMLLWSQFMAASDKHAGNQSQVMMLLSRLKRKCIDDCFSFDRLVWVWLCVCECLAICLCLCVFTFEYACYSFRSGWQAQPFWNVSPNSFLCQKQVYYRWKFC